MSTISKTKLEDVTLITAKRFGDQRGFFSETFRSDWNLLPTGGAFIQDNHAFSAAPHTIRGLHFQYGASVQAKLLRVVAGAILDVAVDIRKGSPTFGQWVGAELTAENGHQLFVPHGFAHGYATLLPDTHVLYKVDHYYDPKREGAVLWSDPKIGIDWLLGENTAELSQKDQDAAPLCDLETPFVYDLNAPFHCICLGD